MGQWRNRSSAVQYLLKKDGIFDDVTQKEVSDESFNAGYIPWNICSTTTRVYGSEESLLPHCLYVFFRKSAPPTGQTQDIHRDVGGNEQHASKETLKDNPRAKEDINIIKKIAEPLQNCAELCTYGEACPEVVQTTQTSKTPRYEAKTVGDHLWQLRGFRKGVIGATLFNQLQFYIIVVGEEIIIAGKLLFHFVPHNLRAYREATVGSFL
ncbi:hypothetical protein L6452_22751 [Arctium lappa]|uniref:Uncharacterized protein n=1 Tax=Arctium lappa TaxID=4217 RepID=A0ACB9B1L0_ARCLA|nr:hypothetical protein L6452_22751 [Arctium lappa]